MSVMLDKLLIAAKLHRLNGRNDEAGYIYRVTLNADGTNVLALIGLGCLIKSGESVDMFCRAIDYAAMNSEMHEVHENVGDIFGVATFLHNNGQHAYASAIYRLLLQVDPEHVHCLYNLGHLVQPDEAMHIYYKALSITSSSDKSRALFKAAIVRVILEAISCEKRQDTLNAERLYRNILSLAPNHISCLLQLSYLLKKYLRHPESIDCLRQALRSYHLNIFYNDGAVSIHNVIYQLAMALQHSDGDVGAAIHLFKRLSTMVSRDYRSHWGLARAYVDMMNYGEAVAPYRRALGAMTALDTLYEITMVYEELFMCLIELGDIEGAAMTRSQYNTLISNRHQQRIENMTAAGAGSYTSLYGVNFSKFISLGSNCSVAMAINGTGKHCHSVFDWLITPFDSISKIISARGQGLADKFTLIYRESLHIAVCDNYGVCQFSCGYCQCKPDNML